MPALASTSPATPATLLSRRSALKTLGLGALSVGALRYLNTPALAAPSGVTDVDILNFALNLEYLEAEYYTYGTTGRSIEGHGIGVSGRGKPGMVMIKDHPQVTFSSDATRQLAEEIAADERAHVTFLRAAIKAAGGIPSARPTIDLWGSFKDAGAAAGLGDNVDPFSDEMSFFLGGFLFEDVGVTAYKGAAPLISNPAYLEAAAGILAVEAYHAGAIRSVLSAGSAAVRDAAQKISDLRDAVDGASDDDQGVTLASKVNLVPADANGLAFSRTPRQVLNIVYLGIDAPAGGFYPNGINGGLR